MSTSPSQPVPSNDDRSAAAAESTVVVADASPAEPQIALDPGASAILGGEPRSRSPLLAPLLFLATAVALNLLLGHWLVQRVGLPAAFDHVGTVVAGILFGPVAGALAGAATMLLQAALYREADLLLMTLPAIWIGLVAGWSAPQRHVPGPVRLLLAALSAALGAALLMLWLNAAPGGGAGYWGGLADGLRAGLRAAATPAGAFQLLGAPFVAFLFGGILSGIIRRWVPPLPEEEAPTVLSVGRTLLRWIVLMVVTWTFLPALGRPLFALFFFPVIAAAWNRGRAGGRVAALVAVALGALGPLLLVAPPLGSGPLLPTDWLWLILFLVVALYVVFVTDTLQRRSAELAATAAARRQADARLKAVTAGVDEALLFVAPDGVATFVNSRFEEYFTQSATDVTGATLEETEELISRAFADPAQFTHFVAETLVEPTGDVSGVLEQEWPVARKLAIRALPVQGDDEYFGRLYLLRDRTLGSELEQLYAGVSSIVNDDLRAPAARVVALATRLLDGAGGELSVVQTRLLSTLRANAERQIALIDAMSEAARLESGQIRLQVATVDLQALVQETATRLRPLLQQTHQTLTVDVPKELPTIDGDADRIAQALTNLISNAHKFNQPGGWVRVEARLQGKHVRIAVSDGGMGIARADQQRIFARFARVENDQTRVLAGSGLGLATVAQVVRLHGGEVEVDSEEGRGSLFAMLLPMEQPEPVEVEAVPLEEEAVALALAAPEEMPVEEAPEGTEAAVSLAEPQNQENATEDEVPAEGSTDSADAGEAPAAPDSAVAPSEALPIPEGSDEIKDLPEPAPEETVPAETAGEAHVEAPPEATLEPQTAIQAEEPTTASALDTPAEGDTLLVEEVVSDGPDVEEERPPEATAVESDDVDGRLLDDGGSPNAETAAIATNEAPEEIDAAESVAVGEPESPAAGAPEVDLPPVEAVEPLESDPTAPLAVAYDPLEDAPPLAEPPPPRSEEVAVSPSFDPLDEVDPLEGADSEEADAPRTGHPSR